jgi:ubiquitin C-terminal hydrolase
MNSKINNYNLYNSVPIENCGSSCFMNSVIQMLFCINEFRTEIIKINYQNNQNNNNLTIFNYIKNIFEKIVEKKKNNFIIQATEINNIYERLYTLCFTNISIKQEDAYQFLQYIFDSLLTVLNNITNDFIFYDNKIIYCVSNISNINNLLLIIEQKQTSSFTKILF